MLLKFVLIEQEHCMDDNVLKKFLSTCMKRASTNIGYNESLFTGLVELHSHFIPFIQELELAVNESITKGLLNDIKECLKNLYYLSNKSTKKLRSLKKLINVLDGLVDLTDNCIEDNGVAPITAYGTRSDWASRKSTRTYNKQICNLSDRSRKHR